MQTNTTIQTLQNETPAITTLLKKFISDPLVRAALTPILIIYENIIEIPQQPRLREANTINILFIIFCGVIGGIFLPLFSPAYLNFLEQILPLVNTTGRSNSFFAYYFGGWLLAYPGSGLSGSFKNMHYKLKYGDSFYFLTPERLQILVSTNVTSSVDPLERINEVFNHVRSRFRKQEFAPGAQAEDLKGVLEVFMNGEPSDAMLEYKGQKLLYKFYRWEKGDTEDIFKPERIARLAPLYKTTNEELTMVLKHCVSGLNKHSKELGATPADYIRTIFNILEETDDGLDCYYEQQEVVFGLRIARAKKLRKNAEMYNNLNDLLNKKSSPNSSQDQVAEAQPVEPLKITGTENYKGHVEDRIESRFPMYTRDGHAVEEKEGQVEDDIEAQLQKRAERRASAGIKEERRASVGVQRDDLSELPRRMYTRRMDTEEQVNLAETLLRENAGHIGLDPEVESLLTDDNLKKLLNLFELRVRKNTESLRSLPKQPSPLPLVGGLEQVSESSGSKTPRNSSLTNTTPQKVSPRDGNMRRSSLGSIERTPELLFRRLPEPALSPTIESGRSLAATSRPSNPPQSTMTALSRLQKAESSYQESRRKTMP